MRFVLHPHYQLRSSGMTQLSQAIARLIYQRRPSCRGRQSRDRRGRVGLPEEAPVGASGTFSASQEAHQRLLQDQPAPNAVPE